MCGQRERTTRSQGKGRNSFCREAAYLNSITDLGPLYAVNIENFLSMRFVFSSNAFITSDRSRTMAYGLQTARMTSGGQGNAAGSNGLIVKSNG